MNQTNHSWNQGSRLPIPAIFVTLLLFILVLPSAIAENVLTNGTTLKGTAGTFMVSSTALDIKSGATLDNAGTLILKNNLTNENGSLNFIGTGTVEFQRFRYSPLQPL
jgi:hypothetical protein